MKQRLKGAKAKIEAALSKSALEQAAEAHEKDNQAKLAQEAAQN